MKGKNLWILTEERPKREVIANILYKFSKDNKSFFFTILKALIRMSLAIITIDTTTLYTLHIYSTAYEGNIFSKSRALL